MVDGPIIQQFGVDDLLNDLFFDLFPELLSGNTLGVLGGHDNGVDPQRDHGPAFLPVFDRDLRLRVRSEPVHHAGPPGSGHGAVQLMCEHDGKRHKLLSLVRGIAEHDTLITSAHRFEGAVVKSLGDIGALLLDSHKNVACLVVETFLGVIIPDLFNRFANDFLVVELGLGGNFTKNHDHSSLGCSFARDFGEWVLGEACIELSEKKKVFQQRAC